MSTIKTSHVFIVINEPLRQGVVKLKVINETRERFYVDQKNWEIITGNFDTFTARTFVNKKSNYYLLRETAIWDHIRHLGKSGLPPNTKTALKKKAQRVSRE